MMEQGLAFPMKWSGFGAISSHPTFCRPARNRDAQKQHKEHVSRDTPRKTRHNTPHHTLAHTHTAIRTKTCAETKTNTRSSGYADEHSVAD